MKPLNRPMFRYGGPIKEGIMSGMKDRPGYSLAGRVGGFFLNTIPKMFKSQPSVVGSGSGIAGKYVPAPLTTTEKIKQFFQTAPAGKFAAGTTEGKLIGSVISGSGKIPKLIKGGVSLAAKSPTATGAILYYGGGALLPDGTPDPNDPKNYKPAGEGGKSGAPGGGDPNMFLTPRDPKINTEKLTKDRIDATKERYYKLMGLDKMKKDSIYDSLIDASKIVQQEGGDLKGAIKSGSLQSQIINAISKNLDDSAKLKRQVDAAVLKGEIEKDIAGAKPGSYLKQAEDYAAMKGVSVSQAYKDLGFDKRGDLNEGVQLYLKTNKVAPAGNDLATLARSYDIDIAGIEDTTTVKNKMKEKGYDEVGYLTEILSKPDAQVAPGNYVINNRVLNVDADKNVTAVF